VANVFNPRNVSEEKFQEVLKKIKSAKSQIRSANVFIPGNIKLVGPALNEALVLGYVDTVMKRASMAGLTIIVLGSGEARKIPMGFDSLQASKQFIHIARKMADVAAKYKMTIAMENLNHTETNMILSFREAVQYAKAIDHPHFKLTADIYHMLMENEPAEHLLEGKGLLVNVHIAEKEERAYPGKRGTDFKPYFRAMKTIGYTGGIMIECRWGKMADELPLAVRYLNTQF
jgi:sugar phosphate isomerase/epimerase